MLDEKILSSTFKITNESTKSLYVFEQDKN